MGIGRLQARTLIDALKLGTAGKVELREELLQAITILQMKSSALEAQLLSAEKEFAATKPAQFSAFVSSLPDVGDPAP